MLYGLTTRGLDLLPTWAAAIGSVAMIAGGLLMPAVCLAAAWRRSLKLLFPLPAACVLGGAAIQGLGLVAAGREPGGMIHATRPAGDERVRVIDPELAWLGVTLPQFVARGHVVASLPSLSLLTSGRPHAR